MVLDKNDSQGFKNSYNSKNKNPLEKNLIWIIYQKLVIGFNSVLPITQTIIRFTFLKMVWRPVSLSSFGVSLGLVGVSFTGSGRATIWPSSPNHPFPYEIIQTNNHQITKKKTIFMALYRKASSRGAYGHIFKCFWRASTCFYNNRYYNGTIYIIDNVIVLSDLVESSGYSSKTLQKGSCPYAPLDEVLRYFHCIAANMSV